MTDERTRSDDVHLSKEGLYERKYSLRHMYSKQNKEILEHISGKSLLEVGCGNGNFLVDAHGIKRVYGIEISELGAKLSKKRAEKSMIVVAVGETIPFADRSFDVVVSRGVIHHLSQPKQAFGEINRVLKSGGKYIIWEGDPTAMYRKIILLITDLLKIKHESSQFRHLSPIEILDSLNKSNFMVKQYLVSGLFAPLAYNGIGNKHIWRILDKIEDMYIFKRVFRWWNLMICEKTS